MLNGGTNLAPGIRDAMTLAAAKSSTHRTIYITLTDGHICDQSEVKTLCERIRTQMNANMPEPVFYMCALGDQVNFSQLESLISAANGGSLTFQFAGQHVCDLLQKAAKTKEGMESLKTIFTKEIVQSGAKKIKILELQAQKLTRMVADSLKKKNQA